MSLLVNDALQNNSPKPLDNKYGVFTGGSFRPYNNIAEANAIIPAAYRSIGLTALINTGSANVEYWYQSSIADGGLVVKSPTSSVLTPLFLSSGSVAIQQSSSSQNGYLSSGDWSLFNGKLSGVTSVGTGTSIYANTSSGTANIKSVAGAGGLVVTDSGTTLTLTPAAVSAVNVGTGAQIFTSLSGFNLQLRSILAGTGLTVTQNASDITIGIANSFAPGAVTTTTATPTTLTSITIEDSSAGLLEVTVVGIIVGSATNCTIAKRYVEYCKQGGVLTLLGGPGDLIAEIDNGSFVTTSWTISVNGTTNNFDIVVTGQASTNIKWATKVTKVFSS